MMLLKILFQRYRQKLLSTDTMCIAWKLSAGTTPHNPVKMSSSEHQQTSYAQQTSNQTEGKNQHFLSTKANSIAMIVTEDQNLYFRYFKTELINLTDLEVSGVKWELTVHKLFHAPLEGQGV